MLSLYPKLWLGNLGFLAGCCLAPRQALVLPRLPKIILLVPKIGFLTQSPIFEDIIQKNLFYHARTPKKICLCWQHNTAGSCVATGLISGIFWIHLYNPLFFWLGILPRQTGLKRAKEPPVQTFQHKKVPIYIILTFFWVKSLLDTLLREIRRWFRRNTLFSGTPCIFLSSCRS